MQSIHNILNELAQNDPTIKMAMQQKNTSMITQANQILPEQVLSKIVDYPAKIQLAEVSIACYFPDRHFAQGKALATDFTRALGGVTMQNGLLGLWENSYKELVPDEILLIKSFSDTPTLANNLDYLLDRVSHWGRVCNEEVMAVEIGNFMGSVMLLISL
ncbi:MAG: hypothetical protein AUK43_01740 [Oscillatoriales cyanobacterium CG2_30_40_61]|nr:MAG: hypothetical protein AUK43_01740 [Oscillatoriales cyanobacterium CG2_30_40_61]